MSLNFKIQAPVLLALILLVVTQSGCQIFKRFGTQPDPAPLVFNALPSQSELITQLNSRASRVRQLQANVDLSLDGVPKLKGTIQIERPDRLRLKAGVMGVSELGLDVGSNSDLFWVWNKVAMPGQTPAIYFARQQDFQRLQNQAALPIEPQWIIDASGLVEFPPTDVQQGPFVDPTGLLKLISTRQTPRGPITRVTLLDAKSALIRQQAFYDASGRRIAYSDSSDFRFYADQEVSLPHRIVLHVFPPDGQELKMVLDASDYRINALFGDPDQMWSMPKPAGVPVINLAQ